MGPAERRALHRVRPDRRRELDPRPGLPAARRAVRGPAAAAAQDGEATACGSRRSTPPFRSPARTGRCTACPTCSKTIPWAKHAGCDRVATTDGLHQPEGLSDDEAMELMKRSYGQIIEVAEAYEITINIEVHGYFTTNPDRMAEMLEFCDSPYPADEHGHGQHVHRRPGPGGVSANGSIDKVAHVHVKDVSESLAAAVRGEQTGIAVSQCAIGDGVNADNITAVPRDPARPRLRRRAEHGVRRAGGAHDRTVAGLAAQCPGGFGNPRSIPLTPTRR